ncbi:MAG: hypothetical protein FJ291_06875, partial [Planctomycetes bacterium]|nr:hypothetical protein [Planctomycetota bacterium]
VRSAGPCLLRDLAVETIELNDHAARLRVSAEAVNLVSEKLEVTLAGGIGEDRLKAELQTFGRKVAVEGGKTGRVEAEVLLPRPRLWWPRGMGEQALYRLSAKVKLDGGAVSDEAELAFGIRTIELAPYEAEGGESRDRDVPPTIARLRVNGQGLDVRGVVWLPADAALRLDASRYERLLARARECGFNTLRVAGGGLAETETFYNLCDREGFLVLQELPLTADGAGMNAEEYLLGASAAIRRIRSHPCLVAWCIGGAAAGGAPDPRLTAESAALCQRLDPQRRMLGDSPRAGPAQLWLTQRDPSTGRVDWSGAALNHVPGLPSPSGYAALFSARDAEPEWPACDDWALGSARAAAPYGPSSSARQHALKAQAAQAAAARHAAERHRLAPAAEVFWQLNEPTPSASPALVDASGAPKAAYHFLRRALADTAIFADFGGTGVPPVAHRPEACATNSLAMTGGTGVPPVTHRPEACATISVGESLHVGVCVESGNGPLRNAQATATVLDRAMTPLFVRESRFDAEAGVVERPLAFDWCAEAALAGDVAFLHLRLDDAAGKPLASNLYWFGVAAPRRTTRRPLRVAWLTAQPRGPLADDAFLAASGIQVTRRGEGEAPAREGEAPAEPRAAGGAAPQERRPPALDGFDAIVVDAAAASADDALKAVAAAVDKGCGLLVVGTDKAVFDSPLGPLLPATQPPAGSKPAGGFHARPTAAVPDHPIVARVAFDLCPRLTGGTGLRPVGDGEAGATVIVALGPQHPLLVEGRHGQGRVLLLADAPGLAAWPDLSRFYAGMLGYLARLPHGELVSLIESSQPSPLQALDRLEPATVEATLRQEGAATVVDIANPGTTLAFMVYLEADAPLSFSDNYFCLLPGESRAVRVEAPSGAPFALTLRGWNVAPRRLRVATR